MKKITNYDQFKNILPYASEMFGVYQPLIGWKSKRKLERNRKGINNERSSLITQLAKNFEGKAQLFLNDGNMQLSSWEIGDYRSRNLITTHESLLLNKTAEKLVNIAAPSTMDEWRNLISPEALKILYAESVHLEFVHDKDLRFQEISQMTPRYENESEATYQTRVQKLLSESDQYFVQQVERESAIAGVLSKLLETGRFDLLMDVFYKKLNSDFKNDFESQLFRLEEKYDDPFLSFDPNKDAKDVCISPLGVVHLFRQFFFEFDTFLGTPTNHVWLSPGSSVELIEVSSRKTVVEKTIETTFESIIKSEKAQTEQSDFSETVKQDNKNDLKLGFTTTVNQSWGTGSASATGSLNLDSTQQVAREQTHKKMRQQSEKISSEVRQSYKTTFKTTTENTDTSSKRYLLNNNTQKLINYELRRKMRQVGVQVQDIGSYLCWETFIDDPGKPLGVANLVHIARPADLVPIPPPSEIPVPSDKVVTFQTNIVWDFDDNEQNNKYHPEVNRRFVPMTTYNIPSGPDGYDLKITDSEGFVDIFQISGTGEDFHGTWAFKGRFINNSSQIWLGVDTGNHGIEWDERVDFVVGGALTYTPNAAKKAEIAAANKKITDAAGVTNAENIRKTKDAYIKAAQERIEIASNIKTRKFEELREEERTIVYRNLINSLMTDHNYKYADNETRHILSELINSIFDIDKMLYFVAPEWWKPREHPNFLGVNDLMSQYGDSVVSWADGVPRPSNYLITDKSQPAVMGSSLGWLLQLDGDNLRNAFLNSPWVKAVIPIRPGKEQAAIKWLQSVKVEGSEGLDAAYSAPQEELNEISTKLLEKDPNDPVSIHPQVTLSDALRYLCLTVAEKHENSNKTDKYPKGIEINDVDKVSATPIEKVFEYGFYPLQGSFRVNPKDPDPNNPDPHYQVFDQWVEILPTDQVVPVEVSYDPFTGRLVRE